MSFFSLSTILFWTFIAWSTSSADAILSLVIARNAAALPIAEVSQFSTADVLFILDAALNSSANPDATWTPLIDISALTTTLLSSWCNNSVFISRVDPKFLRSIATLGATVA